MHRFADKIHAEFIEITERKFPDWPTVYEKLQCADLIKSHGADWCLFFDADALISPEMFDPTLDLNFDTVLFNGKDMSRIRFYPDKYFQRDGRYIGACNWFACASRLTASDLWRPLDDLTLEQAVENINVTIGEQNSGLFKDNHLIDDYTLSRNISRFGLKHDTLIDICGRMGWRNPQTGQGTNPYFFHLYAINETEKINRMLDVLAKPLDQGGWALMTPRDVLDFRAQWSIK